MVHTPSTSLVTVRGGLPRLTDTSLAFGALTRIFARFSELIWGNFWPGATYEIGCQSSAGSLPPWARQEMAGKTAARTRNGVVNLMVRFGGSRDETRVSVKELRQV